MNRVLNRIHGLFLASTILFILAVSVAVETGSYLFAAIPFIGLLVYYSWNKPRHLFFLLLLSLPFSFEYNITASLSTDLPDEPLMWMVTALFFLRILFLERVTTVLILSHPIVILLFVWVCWMSFTVIVSNDPALSIKYLLAKSWYIGAFGIPAAVLFSTKNKIFNAAIILTSSMTLVTLIILMRQIQDGFEFARVNDAVSPFFRNHVNYSGMLVCVIPIAVGIYFISKKPKQRIFAGLAVCILLIALYFSYSRGAWLALLMGVVAWWLIKKRLLFIGFIVSCLLGIAVLLWLKSGDRYLRFAPDFKTTIFHKDFSQHLISTYKLKDLSTAERFYRWVAGVRMLKEHAFTGSGPNTFYPLYKEYAIPAYKTWVSDNPEHSGVHNYFLLTAIEQGLPGLIFFLLLLGSLIYYAEKGYHDASQFFVKIIFTVIAVMIMMIVVLNCLSDLIETDKIGSLFFLCIGTLVAMDIMESKELETTTNIQSVS